MFGTLYLTIGLSFLIGMSRFFKRRIRLDTFNLETSAKPACLWAEHSRLRHPDIVGLPGLTATMGTIITGFVMMFIFGFFLSMPLVLFSTAPSMATRIDGFGGTLKQKRWIIGIVFVTIDIWSIWFGLYVDPENWTGK